MSIEKVIKGRKTGLGELTVQRLLPSVAQQMVGPWIFLDHFGPITFEAGQGIDVGPHPHVNLATVTYLFEGEILHRDSIGNEQLIRPGEINLMVAGKGIMHSERESPETRMKPHSLHGLQLWHALPEKDEETEPSFHHYSAKETPILKENGVEIKVLIGKFQNFASPVKTFCDTLYLDIKMEANQSFTLPQCEELGLYVIDGAIELDDQIISKNEMAILSKNAKSISKTKSACHFMLLGGEKFGTRYIDWSFVSSRRERIEQAKRDLMENKYPPVPGDPGDYY